MSIEPDATLIPGAVCIFLWWHLCVLLLTSWPRAVPVADEQLCTEG